MICKECGNEISGYCMECPFCKEKRDSEIQEGISYLQEIYGKKKAQKDEELKTLKEFSKAFLHLNLVKLDFKNSRKVEIKLLGQNIEIVLNLLIEYSQIIKNSVSKDIIRETIDRYSMNLEFDYRPMEVIEIKEINKLLEE